MDAGELLCKRVILITGAMGFTGNHACRYFAEQGMQVAAVVRQIKKSQQLDGVRYYSCDLLDKYRLEQLIRDIAPDYVLHLGGKNSVPESWDDPLLYIESNMLPILYLLNALRSRPSCRVLVAGSRMGFKLTEPYRPTHPYGLSKSLQKAAVLSWRELFGQSVMLAEPSNLIGPGPSTGFCSLLGCRIVQWERGESTEHFHVSSGEIHRDFLDVRDAVKAYRILLSRGQSGTVYAIGSGKERTLREVVETFRNMTNRDLPIMWGKEQAPESPAPPLSFLEIRRLGWKATIPFERSISDVMQYCRAMKGDPI
ncbi:NAD-dependent epimerase/dehydratase family protein [Paenibacillus sp. KQZ6P-2]|uniref:NAD-dependent epimerase/dehydratase family protein n=1 Tax=Paenibacillus mangrovi TaxID=2931978 RepID=A0A9X2B3S0_9BACL|nr:NAD-dependent epimerase/dehydratase family protein [Paenibacillus mangrovi]MCJ8013889.1 NAD-dependent epimerase/dehydratase family protein [Paenibacillus mangrovi]